MSQKKKSMLLFLVVALLLVLSLVAVFFLNSHNEQGEIARIYQDGKLIREVSLTDVASPYEFQVEASDGGYNLSPGRKRGNRHRRCRLPGQSLPAEQAWCRIPDIRSPACPTSWLFKLNALLPPPMVSMRSCSKNPTLLPLLQRSPYP